MFLMTEMLAHLMIERGLRDRLGQLLEQPVRAAQRHALSRARRTSSSATCS